MAQVTYTPLVRDDHPHPSTSTPPAPRGKKRSGDDLESTRSAPSPPSKFTSENISPACQFSTPSFIYQDQDVFSPMPPSPDPLLVSFEAPTSTEATAPFPLFDLSLDKELLALIGYDDDGDDVHDDGEEVNLDEFEHTFYDPVYVEGLRMWAYYDYPAVISRGMPALPRRLLPTIYTPYANMDREPVEGNSEAVDLYWSHRSDVRSRTNWLKNEVKRDTLEEEEEGTTPANPKVLRTTEDPLEAPGGVVNIEDMDFEQFAALGDAADALTAFVDDWFHEYYPSVDDVSSEAPLISSHGIPDNDLPSLGSEGSALQW